MLYHKDVYLPEPIKHVRLVLELNYTRHALRAAETDRYGKINLPRYLDTEDATLVEVEVDDRDIVRKVVYRTPHCERYDLVLVIIPETAVVKTVWLNERTDSHRTLKTWRYAQA